MKTKTKKDINSLLGYNIKKDIVIEKGYKFKMQKTDKGYTLIKYNTNTGEFVKKKTDILLLALDLRTKLQHKTDSEIKDILKKAQKKSHLSLIKKVYDNTFKNIPFYYSCFWGFDIILFDKFIKTPEGIPCKDYINKLYGNKGVKMLEYVINI